MTWDEVCDSPYLRDLPFKIETNRYGQVVMSPAKSRHSLLQTRIAFLLHELLPEGEVSVELALETSDGVKVPDVIWMSAAFYENHQAQDVYTQAPEICVEVRSASNTREELREKTVLFFERGAREVWLADQDSGAVRFFRSPDEVLPRSALCPNFPVRVKLGR